MKLTASMLRPGMKISGRYEGLTSTPREIESVAKYSTEVKVWFECGDYANLNPNTVVEVADVPAGVERQYCRKAGNYLLRTKNLFVTSVLCIIADHEISLDCSGWAYYRKNGQIISAGLHSFFWEVSQLENQGLIDVSYTDIRLTELGQKCLTAVRFLRAS